MRLLPFIAALALAGQSALAGGLGEMTEAERLAFRAEVRQYLIDNPEVLLEAQQVLQERQDAAQAAEDRMAVSQYSESILADPASWVGGNPQGDITIVEFMDYRCTFCRQAYSEVANLVKTDGNIRFIVKEYPILGDESVISARFAIAVRLLHGDTAYAKVHDALITLRGVPDAETLGRLASTLGLDPKPIIAMMADDQVTSVLKANYALADKLKITGTPTFVIDQVMLRSYVPEEDLRKIVAEQRAG